MNWLKKFIGMYRDGLKNQSRLGRKLWLIVIIKLIIMFGVLKIFFFNDFLNSKFDNEKDKADHVVNILTKPVQNE